MSGDRERTQLDMFWVQGIVFSLRQITVRSKFVVFPLDSKSLEKEVLDLTEGRSAQKAAELLSLLF